MQIDIDTYRSIHTSRIKSAIERKRKIDSELQAGQDYATGAGMPIITIIHILCELYGEKPEYIDKIKALIGFYRVSSLKSDVELDAFEDLYERRK